MNNKILYFTAFITLIIATLAYYNIGNTPNNNVPQGLNAGTMKRFIVADKLMAAPQSVFLDERGNEVTFSDFKGKVILVNLWATWCAPCIKEMPDLNDLQKAMEGTNFQIILISENQDGIESSIKFLKDNNISHLKTYIDPKRKIARTLKANALPTSVLFDQNGNEVGRLVGPALWNSEDAMNMINYFLRADNT